MTLPFEKYGVDIRFIAFLVLLLFFSDGEGLCLAGEIVGNKEAALIDQATNIVDSPITPSQALTADVSGYRIVDGIAILPILPGNETMIQGLLTSLAQDGDFQGISMTLFTPVGTRPKILLSCPQDEDRLRYAVQKLKVIMRQMGQPHRIVVGAYLREITIDNNDVTGLSLFSNGIQAGLSTGVATTITRQWASDSKTPPDLLPAVKTKVTSGYTGGLINPVNVVGNLTKSMSKGKVIVGSEINIVNGATAELKNDDSIPVPLNSGGSNNTITFNTQVISSDIKITPTIVSYNEEKPEESIVCLDVVIQLSVPTNTVTFSGGASALEYTSQTLTSTHYVKANNERIIGGLFASDVWIKSHSGIPILMNIPIIKSLFSSDTVSLQHSASLLTLAVRILPMVKEDGYDY